MATKIHYSLIAKGMKPLVDYKEIASTSIEGTCVNYLSKVEQNATKAIMNKDKDNFIYFYTNESGITVMIVADEKYPKATAVGCLNAIKKVFLEKYQTKNLNSTEKLGLNPEFRDTLKEKVDFFNSHLEYSSEEIFERMEYLNKIKDKVIEDSRNADFIHERDKIAELDKKYQETLGDSKRYYKESVKARKKNCLIM